MLRFILAVILLVLPMQAFAADVTVTDDDVTGATVNWTSDNVYLLEGFVFVEDGTTLNIEAGTVIKGKPGQGADASALVVARGGKIMAEGTADNPIIFTAESDPMDGSLDGTSGLWGGVILLGKATINTATGVGNIEGIPESEPRGAYGGDDDMDNSGVMRYVSIRHGGTDIGEANEINGLTMGAVGAGTTIEYIEVFNNNDDGYEWFGGTVNCKYLIAAFCKDDSFDIDEGYRGQGQFWFTIQSDDWGDKIGEHDGGTEPEDGLPYAHPVVYNVTAFGKGMNSLVEKGAFNIRDNWGGEYHNSIFADVSEIALKIEDLESGEDSRNRLETGDILFANNIFHNFAAGSTFAELCAESWIVPYVISSNNIADPYITYISRTANNSLDPRPAMIGPAYSGTFSEIPEDSFFVRTAYKGAFGTENWAHGWSALSTYNYLIDDSGIEGGTITVSDGDVSGTTVNWTNNNVYLLDGFVFVEDGTTLNIEAGTVIKGKPGQGADASALVVARGGKIMAEGTADNPIIFTAESDPMDGSLDGTSGLWGGVILLGKATINTATGVGNIEGIPESEPRGAYGGDDDMDNSGVMRYVSIRHGGTDIGEANEINGLTMGAVGAGTTIEYIEVFNNNDDGYEWFGGTVNCKYLIAAFCKDDSFDIDEGYRGQGQFWFTIQSDDWGDKIGEHDGGTEPEDGLPYAHPVVYNVTAFGKGMNSLVEKGAFNIRDNWGGEYHNSIFADVSEIALKIEDLESGEDSRNRLETGDIVFANNIFHDFAAGSTFAELCAESWIVPYVISSNTIADPMITNISRTSEGMLDPRPAVDGAAYGGRMSAVPENIFFESVNYKGAFGTSNWAAGWSALCTYGYFVEDNDLPVAVAENDGPVSIQLDQNYPNPFNPTTTIRFSVVESGKVSLKVYDMLGRNVDTIIENDLMTPGSYSIQYDGTNLSSGMYFYRLENGSSIVTKRMTLIK